MDHPLGYAITYTDDDLIGDLAELAVALGKGNSARALAVLQTAITRLRQLVDDKDRKIMDASDDFLADCLEEVLKRYRP